MTFALGTRSLCFCQHVDQKLIEVARLAISLSAQDFGFTEEQSRTLAYEQKLVAEGHSHTTWSHHIIDRKAGWAAPGFSGAVDAVPWIGGKPTPSEPSAPWSWNWNRVFVIAEAFRKASLQLDIPITWGGCWDRLMSEYNPAWSVQTVMKDYVARHRSPGHNPFVDGVHFEIGRN